MSSPPEHAHSQSHAQDAHAPAPHAHAHKKYLLRRSPHDERDVMHVGAIAPPVPSASASVPPPLPKHVDLRGEMPAVLDQSSLGSCALNAASNCLRHLLRRERLREFQPSRLYLYWNTRVNVESSPAGEDTGVCIRDVCKAVRAYHACDETVWPYDVAKFSVAPPLTAYRSAALHCALSYAYVPQTLDAMRRTLAGGLPIMVGLQLYDSFESQAVALTGVVPMPALRGAQPEQCLGGHAVLVCGYDDATETFLVMNSWGTGWGQAGFFCIPYAYVLDPALASDFWVFSTFA
jgi:C1A family cysteine protease